jgi:phosphoribosylaminoimidazole-succinocarboxamide synthase
MEKQVLLYEGKAKRIYQTDEKETLWVEYKDSATAFNGEKTATITGKGKLNNEITSLLFDKLKQAGIDNHFIKKLSDTEQLIKAVTIIPIEVVVRNIAAGSLAKRLGLEEGVPLKETIVEWYYKRDDLGDPFINDDHIRILELATQQQLIEMKEIGLKVNEVLANYFESLELRLVDFKLEFGVTADGELLLSDEISPDTCRLWDIHTNEKFDKDVFRRDLGDLTKAYEEILKRLGGSSCTK